MPLNSKTRIKLIDVNITINDKTATIKYNIPITTAGLLLISGSIGSGVFFSIVINYGTKWSIKLLSFTASNTDTSSIVINSDLGKITFNGNSKLESYYEVNGLLLCWNNSIDCGFNIKYKIIYCNLQNCKISIYTYTINRPSNGRSKNKGIFIRLFIKIKLYFS